MKVSNEELARKLGVINVFDICDLIREILSLYEGCNYSGNHIAFEDYNLYDSDLDWCFKEVCNDLKKKRNCYCNPCSLELNFIYNLILNRAVKSLISEDLREFVVISGREKGLSLKPCIKTLPVVQLLEKLKILFTRPGCHEALAPLFYSVKDIDDVRLEVEKLTKTRCRCGAQ